MRNIFTFCLLLLVVATFAIKLNQNQITEEIKLRHIKHELYQNGEKIYRSFNKTTDTDKFAQTLLEHDSYIKKNQCIQRYWCSS